MHISNIHDDGKDCHFRKPQKAFRPDAIPAFRTAIHHRDSDRNEKDKSTPVRLAGKKA